MAVDVTGPPSLPVYELLPAQRPRLWGSESLGCLPFPWTGLSPSLGTPLSEPSSFCLAWGVEPTTSFFLQPLGPHAALLLPGTGLDLEPGEA